jgi:hypothetical protein
MVKLILASTTSYELNHFLSSYLKIALVPFIIAVSPNQSLMQSQHTTNLTYAMNP